MNKEKTWKSCWRADCFHVFVFFRVIKEPKEFEEEQEMLVQWWEILIYILILNTVMHEDSYWQILPALNTVQVNIVTVTVIIRTNWKENVQENENETKNRQQKTIWRNRPKWNQDEHQRFYCIILFYLLRKRKQHCLRLNQKYKIYVCCIFCVKHFDFNWQLSWKTLKTNIQCL